MAGPALSPQPTVAAAAYEPPVEYVADTHAYVTDTEMMDIDPPAASASAGHVERSVSPARRRIKIESAASQGLRSLRAQLARHPVGQRILQTSPDGAVDAFLSDQTVMTAAALPPSKEVAAELRDLFAHTYCAREFAAFGASLDERPVRRAIEALVSSWDWDLKRVEQSIERHVVCWAGAGESDVPFVNFLLGLRECRAVLRDAPALRLKIAEVGATREAVLCCFESRGWVAVPEPTVHAVIARVRCDEAACGGGGSEPTGVSVEDAVDEALATHGDCLRRAAYNARVRDGALARYHGRLATREERRAGVRDS